MFGEEPCESPRLASRFDPDAGRISNPPQPWRNLSSSASSLSHSPLSLSSRSTSAPGTPDDRALERSPPHIRRSDSIETFLSNGLEEDFDGLSLGHGLIMQARKELPEGVRTIGPESDKTGHIEYKFVLKTPTTPHRLARLVTQLKWRLIEGGGCAVYELGVLDAGTLVGLSRVDMQETLDTLGLMLSHLGRGHVRISRVVLLGGAGGGREISSTTPPHEADTTPSSSTLGFTSFDVGSTAIQPVYPGTSPITIKQLNPPNPEREPEERAALKRNKRDARRVKQRNYGGDIVATGYPRPNMESMESSTFNKARAIRQYEAGAVRQPRNFRPSTGQVPGSTPEETYAPTRRPPNSTKQQAPTRPKVILTESIPSHRPRILSEDENEERFVVEAVVMKRPSSAMPPCKGESSDEGLEGMLARTSNDGSSLDAGPGSDEMFGSVDDEEGWSYLAFDSLPKVRRESSSVVV